MVLRAEHIHAQVIPARCLSLPVRYLNSLPLLCVRLVLQGDLLFGRVFVSGTQGPSVFQRAVHGVDAQIQNPPELDRLANPDVQQDESGLTLQLT